MSTLVISILMVLLLTSTSEAGRNLTDDSNSSQSPTQISGFVYNAGMKPMGGVPIRLETREGNKTIATTESQADGRFHFKNVAYGDYTLWTSSQPSKDCPGGVIEQTTDSNAPTGPFMVSDGAQLSLTKQEPVKRVDVSVSNYSLFRVIVEQPQNVSISNGRVTLDRNDHGDIGATLFARIGTHRIGARTGNTECSVQEQVIKFRAWPGICKIKLTCLPAK